MDKMPIVGMGSRNGKIIANVVKNAKQKTLLDNIYQHIEINSIIITDELLTYIYLYNKVYKV